MPILYVFELTITKIMLIIVLRWTKGVITSNGVKNNQIKKIPIGSYMKSVEKSKEFLRVLNKTKQTQKF